MKYFFFFILFSISSFGQTLEDSLLTLISNSNSDIEKISYYNSLVWNLRSNKPKKAIQYGNDAISLIQKINRPELLSKTYNYVGVVYRNKGDFTNAIMFYNQALENALKFQDSTQIAYAYNNLGGIYKIQGNSPMALDYMLKALRYFEATNNKSGIGFCTINIATLYRRENDYESALKYLNLCLDVRRELNYKHGIALALYQKALILKGKKKYHDALKAYNEVLKLFQELNDIKGIAVTYEGIGAILVDLKDYKNAKTNLTTARKLSAQVDDKQTSARTSFKLALLSALSGNKNEAFDYLQKGKELVNKLNVSSANLEGLRYETELYEILGDFKKSLELYKKYTSQKDSIYSVANKEKVASIQAAFNMEKEQVRREQENANLRKELHIKRTQRFYGIIVLILIIMLIIIIFWKYRTTSKLAAQLEEAIVIKDKFMKILAHDLRNPINTTMGFLDLLKSDHRKMTPEEREEIIELANSSIKKNNLLLENLLEWNRHQSKDYQPQIKHWKVGDVFIETVNILQPLASGKNITLTHNFDANLVCRCDKNMMKTILRNLLNNAVKFTRHGGNIKIHCTDEGGFIKIAVQDNGVGIPEEFQDNILNDSFNFSSKGTQNETGSGLGLVLCKEYAEINGGKLGFSSKVNVGSTFWFTIPKV